MLKWIALPLACLGIVISYWLQTHTFLDPDVAWHVEGARRLLQKGKYLTDIIDDNPPFVFRFYYPVIWLQSWTKITYLKLIPAYILSINTMALTGCYYFINKLSPFNKAHCTVLFCALIFIFFLLPAMSHGQREMVMISLLMPYFLFNIFFSPRLTKSNPMITLFWALVASFAILQNIFYIGILFILDSARYFQKKPLLNTALFVYMGIFFQLVLLFFFFPAYTHVIVPLTICYEKGFNFSLLQLLSTEPFLLCACTLLLSLFVLRTLEPYQKVTLLTFIYCFFLYFLEKKGWYYHLYPACAFSVLFLTFLWIQLNINEKSRRSLTNPNTHQNGLRVLIICSIIAIFVSYIRMLGLSAHHELQQFSKQDSAKRQWINFSNKYFYRKKVFYLAPIEPYGYSLPIYADVNNVSPWLNAWFIPYLLLPQKITEPFFCQPRKDMQLFFKMTQDAISKESPDFIVIKIPRALKGNTASFLPKISTLLDGYYFYKNVQEFYIYKKER